MTVAIWIIDVCEVIRIMQNAFQLLMVRRDMVARDNAYAEAVESMKAEERGLIRDMLEEWENSTERKG